MNILFPSSPGWTGGILCRSGYHFVDNSSQGGTSGSGGNFEFLCVNGDSSLGLTAWLVLPLEVLVGYLVLWGAVAGIVLIGRLRRRSKVGLFWPCVLIGALGCLALIVATAIQGGGFS